MAIYAGTYSAVLPGGQHFILTQDPGLINYVLRENHTNYHKSELTSKRGEGFLEMDCFFPRCLLVAAKTDDTAQFSSEKNTGSL